VLFVTQFEKEIVSSASIILGDVLSSLSNQVDVSDPLLKFAQCIYGFFCGPNCTYSHLKENIRDLSAMGLLLTKVSMSSGKLFGNMYAICCFAQYSIL
jgi:uncharacterized membrane protein AbrB (regulator of aidB expression)